MALLVDIEKRLGSFHLNVDFEAGDEVLSLLGASGCGKSMTLKCIAGIERPDRGRIVLNDRVLFDSEKGIDLPPQKRRVGYLFQQYALFPNMTVQKNISVGVREKTGKTEAIVREMIRAMRLDGCENQYPHQLSGGQQQRVALARILVNEPEVLLLDEPFSSLDSYLRFQLEQEVRHVIRQFGKTVILVSHDRDEVFRFSDTVAVIQDGELETIGTKQEVFQAPKTKSGALLTGCKNISRVERREDQVVFAKDWGVELQLGRDLKKSVYIGIKAHDIVLGEGVNAFRCLVTEEVEGPFFNTLMLRPVQTNDGAPIIWETEKGLWNRGRGGEVTVRFPPEAILLLEGGKQEKEE